MKKWYKKLILIVIITLPAIANADVIPSRDWPRPRPTSPKKPKKSPVEKIPTDNPPKKESLELEFLILLSAIGILCLWKLNKEKLLLTNKNEVV